MLMTMDRIRRISRKVLTPAAEKNANSVLAALAKYGKRVGLDRPHRLVQFIAQVMHESGEFAFDRELWGPTPAQVRYEGRRDLGNTQPGDGSRFRGRTAMQITGRANTAEFRDWCRRVIDPGAPDFEAQPDLMNTDPWEGLGPIWYWDTRNLNRAADQGDVETITKRINGGLNGFSDRVDLLVRASLIMAGFRADDIRGFQASAQRVGLIPKDEPGRPSQVDGDAGPKTRAALHRWLASVGGETKTTQSAPVVDEKPVAVTPPELDKSVSKTAGFWERIGQIALAGGSGLAAVAGDWRVVAALAVAGIVVGSLGLAFHARIIAAVKTIKQELGG